MSAFSSQLVRFCTYCRVNTRVAVRVHPRTDRRRHYCHHCNSYVRTEPKHRETKRD